jgi:thiamine-phosphate pyrophosphorylase
MGWREEVFKDFRLYAVTDLRAEEPGALRKIEQAYRGGTDIVQLRSKVLSDVALIRLGLKTAKLAAKYKKLFFVNDRVDLALVTGADGVHLGQDDMTIPAARKLAARMGHKLWIGKSTHSLRQAFAAVKEGADYIGVGPVFPTPTKPNANSVGLQYVRQAALRIQIPWVAIGGIDLKNIFQVTAAGATRIAVVRAIFAAKEPEIVARKLKNVLLRHCERSEAIA